MNIDQIIELSKASIDKEDLKILLQILLPLQPKNILEIGTWKGYSADVWIKAFEPFKFITIEKDEIVDDAIQIPHIHGTNTYLWNKDSKSPDTYEMVVSALAGFQLDFLFIDGDHSLMGVNKDWEMYGPLVKKGGVVVFHDVVYTSNDPLAPVQVKFLWDVLNKTHKYVEIKSLKSTGIGVLYV